MDCAICYEPITQSTGKATLSCSHEFHMGCITTAIIKGRNTTCPYCRHNLDKKEIPVFDAVELADEELESAYTEFYRTTVTGLAPYVTSVHESDEESDEESDDTIWENLTESLLNYSNISEVANETPVLSNAHLLSIMEKYQMLMVPAIGFAHINASIIQAAWRSYRQVLHSST